MKIVVFGATGGTGKQVIERALVAGHDVVAVARDPSKVAARDRVTAVKGDVLDAASCVAAVQGADAAISAIGPADDKNPGTLMSVGTANMVAACTQANVARFVFESGLMLSSGAELSLVSRLGIGVFKRLVKKLHDDKVIAERSITASTLDWVIVRPPGLKDGAFTGTYLAGPLARVNATKTLAFGDVADARVKAAASAEWSKKIVNVGHA